MDRGEKEGSIVVGTVTFMNKSAMIWIGWGDIEPDKSVDSLDIGNYDTVGTGKLRYYIISILPLDSRCELVS